MATAQTSAAPTPLVQHAWACLLFDFGSWGFDLDNRFGDIDRIHFSCRKGVARHRDLGWLCFADLRVHRIILSYIQELILIDGG